MDRGRRWKVSLGETVATWTSRTHSWGRGSRGLGTVGPGLHAPPATHGPTSTGSTKGAYPQGRLSPQQVSFHSAQPPPNWVTSRSSLCPLDSQCVPSLRAGPLLFPGVLGRLEVTAENEADLLPGVFRVRAHPRRWPHPLPPLLELGCASASVYILTSDTDPELSTGQPRLHWGCGPWGPHRLGGPGAQGRPLLSQPAWGSMGLRGSHQRGQAECQC